MGKIPKSLAPGLDEEIEDSDPYVVKVANEKSRKERFVRSSISIIEWIFKNIFGFRD